MKFTIMRLRALENEVARLATATERLAAVAESCALEYFNYHPIVRAKLSDEERQVDVLYTDETQDLVREMRSKLGTRSHDESDDEVL